LKITLARITSYTGGASARDIPKSSILKSASNNTRGAWNEQRRPNKTGGHEKKIIQRIQKN